MSEMRDRMLAGELYRPADSPELEAAMARARDLCLRRDAPDVGDEERDALLRELLGHVGEQVTVRTGFRCDYGTHLSIGDRTFANFGLVVLDCAEVRIGNDCQLATNVQLLTATHPLDPADRRSGWELAHPIVLEDDVWLGGGVIVCPGVTVGTATVVGAGAVVTKDLPPGVVAVGNPARVVREIGDADRVVLP